MNRLVRSRSQPNIANTLLCTGMNLHSAGCMQLNSISATAYSTFSSAQLSTIFTARLSTFHGFYRTNNMDHLTSTIPHQIPPFEKDSHRELALREAAHLQSQLSSSNYVGGIKATARLFIASVSKQKPNAHFIAMVEIVGRSASIWTCCCAIRYFQSRTKHKISSTDGTHCNCS